MLQSLFSIELEKIGTKLGRNNYSALVDTSVKQTMTRSLFTSLTTFFTVLCLYIFGVQSVREFVLPIAIGIICGTYSSIFISGNIWYIISNATSKKRLQLMLSQQRLRSNLQF